MTIEKLSQVVTLMAPAVPDSMPSLQLLNTPPGTSYTAIGLANAIFLVSRHKNPTRSNLFSVGKASSVSLHFYLEDMLSFSSAS